MNGIVLLRVDRLDRGGGHPRHLHPALDLKSLQSALGADIVDGWVLPGGPEVWVRQVLVRHPRVVVIKAETWCLPEAVACARLLRSQGVITIATGQQVSHVMKMAVEGWRESFDLALAGEAEVELLSLLPSLLAGDRTKFDKYRDDFAQGVHFSAMDPDSLAWPKFSDKELREFAFPFPLQGRPVERWAYVLTARGCPHRCLHCSVVVRKSFGDVLRKRSPVAVADEISGHLDRGAEAIAFEDDTLLVDRKHFLSLCDELLKRGLRFPWIGNARPDELDHERVSAAASVGARLIKVGVETDSARLLSLIGKTRHPDSWKSRANDGFALLRQFRIGSVGLFLVGLPTQTRREVEDTLDWALELAPDYVQVQIFRGYPDIPWWPELPVGARENGGAWHYGTISTTAAAIPVSELTRLQKNFYRKFYFRPSFILRHAGTCWRHYASLAKIRRFVPRLAYLAGYPVKGMAISEVHMPSTARSGVSREPVS